MQRRFLMTPYVIVGVLGLLAAGAAIVGGVVMAPTSTDLTVHNAAGETVRANTVSGRYSGTTLGTGTIHFTYRAPDLVISYYRGPDRSVSHAPHSTTGPAAQQIFGPVDELRTVTGFHGHGSVYLVSETIKPLVAAAERSTVTGTFRAVATVATGYVVQVQEHIAATQSGRHYTERFDFRLDRIDSWTRR